jgi:hypothetical protein
MGAIGLEPMTPSLSSKELTVPNQTDKALTTTDPLACTTACTPEGKTEKTDPVNALAAALLSLSPSDRAWLAALLLEPAQAKDTTDGPRRESGLTKGNESGANARR